MKTRLTKIQDHPLVAVDLDQVAAIETIVDHNFREVQDHTVVVLRGGGVVRIRGTVYDKPVLHRLVTKERKRGSR